MYELLNRHHKKDQDKIQFYQNQQMLVVKINPVICVWWSSLLKAIEIMYG